MTINNLIFIYLNTKGHKRDSAKVFHFKYFSFFCNVFIYENKNCVVFAVVVKLKVDLLGFTYFSWHLLINVAVHEIF